MVPATSAHFESLKIQIEINENSVNILNIFKEKKKE